MLTVTIVHSGINTRLINFLSYQQNVLNFPYPNLVKITSRNC